MRYPDLVKTVQDLTGLHWEEGASTSGSGGSFLKALSGEGTAATYYKASTYDSANGFFGHECVNELVASRLMEVLGIEHVKYSLVHARIKVREKEYVTWINSSKSYRHSNESKQSFSQFFEQYRQPGEAPFALCERMGWGRAARQTMLLDYLIINQDRHGANVEVLHLPDGRKRLAPVFDSGNSLLFSCYDVKSAICAFDPMVDAIGTNFIGSKRLADNLELLGAGLVNPLREEDRGIVMRGLDAVLPPYHLDKIWEIIWRRWCVYADVRDR